MGLSASSARLLPKYELASHLGVGPSAWRSVVAEYDDDDDRPLRDDDGVVAVALRQEER